MRILSLNAWYGNCHDQLYDFLKERIDHYDIFCFQEANGPKIESILNQLFEEQHFHELSTKKYFNKDLDYCLRTFIRKSIPVNNSTTLMAVDDTEIGQALAVELRVEGQELVVVNIHGIPNPGDKLDTPKRLEQSQTIIDYIKKLEKPAIVIGDFNLLPETASVKMFEESGYRDLVKEYNIPTTRNSLAWERFPDNPQLFADYAFLTSDINVRDFQVIDNLVSDHLPMIIDFEV